MKGAKRKPRKKPVSVALVVRQLKRLVDASAIIEQRMNNALATSTDVKERLILFDHIMQAVNASPRLAMRQMNPGSELEAYSVRCPGCRGLLTIYLEGKKI